jgi:hypothetical protein
VGLGISWAGWFPTPPCLGSCLAPRAQDLRRIVAGDIKTLPVFVNARAIGSHDIVSDREEVEISTRGKMGVRAKIAFSEIAFDFHESDFLRLAGPPLRPCLSWFSPWRYLAKWRGLRFVLQPSQERRPCKGSGIFRPLFFQRRT